MKSGIIGAGNIGSALAVHFRKLEHAVWIANSRGPETLSRVAEETGAIPINISEIAKGVDDAGPLSESWRYQPGTPAYCPDPTIRQLPSLLMKARRDKASGNRDQAAKIMAKLPPDFSPQELVRVARLSAGLDAFKPRSWIAALRLGYAALRAA